MRVRQGCSRLGGVAPRSSSLGEADDRDAGDEGEGTVGRTGGTVSQRVRREGEADGRRPGAHPLTTSEAAPESPVADADGLRERRRARISLRRGSEEEEKGISRGTGRTGDGARGGCGRRGTRGRRRGDAARRRRGRAFGAGSRGRLRGGARLLRRRGSRLGRGDALGRRRARGVGGGRRAGSVPAQATGGIRGELEGQT